MSNYTLTTLINPRIEIPNEGGSYGTIARIIGECPTCSYVMGYNFGHNTAQYPINCRYASYSPGHISCPNCGTEFVANSIRENRDDYTEDYILRSLKVVGIPKNHHKYNKSWHSEFLADLKEKEQLEKKKLEVLPKIVLDCLNSVEPKGNFTFKVEDGIYNLYDKDAKIYSCDMSVYNVYYFPEIFFDPAKHVMACGELTFYVETIRNGELYCRPGSGGPNTVNLQDSLEKQKIVNNLIAKYLNL